MAAERRGGLSHAVELLPELGGLEVVMGGGEHAVDVAELPVAMGFAGRHDFPRPDDSPARLHGLDDEEAEGNDRAEAEQ